MDQQYILTLAREYIQLVEMLDNGDYDTWRAIDSARQIAHNALCDALNVDKSVDMYALCKNMVHDARSIGDYDYDFDFD
jgi:hypothetical protein